MQGKNKTKEVDIWNICQSFAFDIIGTTAFGSSFNMIENETHEVVSGLGISLKFLVQKAMFHKTLLPFLGIYKIAKVILNHPWITYKTYA